MAQTRIATWWTWDEARNAPKRITKEVHVVNNCAAHQRACVRLDTCCYPLVHFEFAAEATV
jgi:hypothetical protein